MKRALLFVALAAAAIVSAESALGAGFTYHGVLQDAGKPAQGKYDIQLTLYTSPNGGTIVGGPLTLYGVDVREGSFSTDADFGPLAKGFDHVYVGVKVRSAGTGDFIPLDNLQAVTTTNTSCPGSWSLDGNAGNPTGSYVGTADAQDLLLYAGGQLRERLNSSKNAVGIAGGVVSASSGQDSVAVSDSNSATGDHSFAGGYSGGTLNDGSFVWGDHPAASHFIYDSGPNQFVVQAGGGMAVNGTPKDSSTELSIYPSAGNGGDFSEMFMGGRTGVGGMLLTAQAPSTATSNDAALYIDQYDGTHQSRRLVIDPSGRVGINTIRAQDNSSPLDATMTLRDPQDSSLLASLKLEASLPNKQALELTGNNNNTLGSPDLLILSNDDDGSENFRVILTKKDLQLFHNGGGLGALVIGTDSTNGNAARLTYGGVWTNASSRTFKDGFAHVDAIGVLDKLISIPVQTWFYKNDHQEGRHMGPVAEDFSETFGLGNDEQHIGTVDESGVAFAAIQGLNKKLETENSELRSKLDDVLARLEKLEAGKEK